MIKLKTLAWNHDQNMFTLTDLKIDDQIIQMIVDRWWWWLKVVNVFVSGSKWPVKIGFDQRLIQVWYFDKNGPLTSSYIHT